MRTNKQIISEVSACFGYLPSLFVPDQENTQVLDNLWQQTLAAYVNNPLPTLFKEKLFAYLSRYCSVSYCIVCHSCALGRLGMSAKHILQLLESPAPTLAELEEIKALLANASPLTSLPEPDYQLEKAIFSCCIYIFLNPKQDANCREELRRILGVSNYNHLMKFLAYIKTCHLWVEAHPALTYQIDPPATAVLGNLFAAEPKLVEFFRSYNESQQPGVKSQKSEVRNQESELQHRAVSLRDISDRISTEDKLQQNEELFQQLTQNIRQVFWIVSPCHSKIFYISPAYEEIWGRDRQQLYDNPACFIDSVHPMDRAHIIAAQDQQLQGEAEIEYRIIRPDNQERWIRDRAFPIFNAQGEVERLVGIADDITERKQLQEELRESEERLKFALCAARMGRWEWNILTNKITWSENLEALFGLEQGAFDGTYESFINYVHPQDRDFVNQSVMQAVQEEAQYDIEFRVVWADGTIRFCQSKGYVFRDSLGNPVRMTGVDIDITKRKQIEKQLRLLESVVVNAKDAILITEAEPIDDPGPKILYANAAFTRMTGYSCEEILGKTPRFLQGAKSDRPTLDKIRAALSRWESICVELINYRKDGSEFWTEISLVPVADETGCYTHWVAIQRDISDRKRQEAEYQMLLSAEQAARGAAETANRTKDEFLAIVSHELRSPLNAMLGWVRLLRTRKFDAAKTAQALEIIERNARLQAQLIEDLLDISRMIRGKLLLNLTEVNLISVIEAAIDVIRTSALSKNIQLNFTIEDRTSRNSQLEDPNSEFSPISPSPPALILGDPVRLQQIVWNLLSNAVKFTPEGGKVEIKLSTVIDGRNGQLPITSYAQLQVSDTGKGISPEFLPYVFERFRQADSTITRAQSGLGLGLAIVRSLVELHHGSVYVESPGEGLGSTFTVKLPLLEMAGGQKGRGAEEQNGDGGSEGAQENSSVCAFVSRRDTNPKSKIQNSSRYSALENLQILVVDDEADARELLTTVLEQYGAKVTAVASVAEALDAFEKLQPNVLVSDIGMPHENGYSLIRKLRNIEAERGGRIPAIALTAYARSEDQAAAIAAGFQIHLAKPVEPAQLVAVVANIIQQ